MSLDTGIGKIVIEVVHKIRPEDTVLDALRTMLEKDIGCLVVSGVGGPIGMVTEKDILRHVTVRRLDPGKVQVKEVMSTPLISTAMDTSVGDAAKKMVESKVKRLVVMGEDGSFLGLVTMTDIVRWVAQSKELSDSLLDFLMYDVP